jgi:hypothetical protein
VQSDDVTTVTMKITAFWNVMPEDVVHSSEIMVNFYHITCCNIQDDSTLFIILFYFTMNRREYQLSNEIKHYLYKLCFKSILLLEIHWSCKKISSLMAIDKFIHMRPLKNSVIYMLTSTLMFEILHSANSIPIVIHTILAIQHERVGLF